MGSQERKKVGTRRRAFSPKMGREVEKPGGFPASKGSWSTRKEEGPEVTCEVEIRKAVGSWQLSLHLHPFDQESQGNSLAMLRR